LHHADSPVRVRAAELLGATQDRRAVDELLRALTHDDPATRIAAATALGQHGKTSRIVGPLVEAFHDPSARVRTAVAFALSRFDALGSSIPPERMRPVVEHLLRHPDVEARRRVILMLGRSRDGPDSVELLLTALHDREGSIRAEAIVALSRFRDPRIEPALRIALTDAEEMVRLRAVDAMERLGTPEPLPLALKDPSPLVRVQALKALRWTGAEPVLAELLASLRDPAEAVRLEVVELLAGHPTCEVIDALIDTLPRESFPLLRQKMLALVGKHSDGRARDVFRSFLDDGASEVRAQVVHFLGELADPALVPDLLTRGDDEAAEVRLALVRALERVPLPPSRDALGNFLADPAPEVRDAAVWALRHRPVDEALSLALPLLADPTELVRLGVAVLLAVFHVRGDLSLERLAILYEQAPTAGRLALLEVCDGIRDRRLVPLLVGAILHGEAERPRVLQVLASLKRGEPARRHPRVTEELHRLTPTRPSVRVIEPVASPGTAVLDEAITFRVSAPARLAPGTTAVIRLWAALPGQVASLEPLAARPLDESDYRIQSRFGNGLAPRVALSATLHADGLEIIDTEDDLYWDGQPAAARFLVRIPADALPRELPARIVIYREGYRIAEVTTTLEIGPDGTATLRSSDEVRCPQIPLVCAPQDEASIRGRLAALRRVVPWLAHAPVTVSHRPPDEFPDPDAIWAHLRGRGRS
jgi:HEAT repeat protein